MNNADRQKPSSQATERRDDSSTPHARAAEEMHPEHDQLHIPDKDPKARQEALLDEAVEETFPASDPVSAKRIT